MANTGKRSLVSRAGAAARKAVGRPTAKAAAGKKTVATAKKTAPAKKAPAVKKAPAKKAAARKAVASSPDKIGSNPSRRYGSSGSRALLP